MRDTIERITATRSTQLSRWQAVLIRASLLLFLVPLLLPAPSFAQAVTFAPAAGSPFGAGTGPVSVAIGDLNGDGKPDLVVVNQLDNTISVQWGTGAGSFGAATTFAVGFGPYSVAIGDLNRDGKPDLAVANQAGIPGATVSVLWGTGLTGPTGFGAATNFDAGPFPFSVAIGDLNGDGKPDLVTTNDCSATVSVLLGTGATGPTGFGAATPIPVAGVSCVFFVAIGDLNGDGKLDLAVANENNANVSVLLGNGTGGFGAAVNYGVGTFPQFLAIGDLNGDGTPDLSVANAGSNNLSVLLGSTITLGTFGAAVNYGVGTAPFSVAIGDLNGDGAPDLVTTNNGIDRVSVLLGSTITPGTFGVATPFAVGSQPDCVAIGDLNGDGKPDLAVGNGNSSNVSVLLNSTVFSPRGGFSATTAVAVGINPQSVAIGDLNRDGKPDLAVAEASGSVSVLLGTGGGAFGAATIVPVGTSLGSVAIGDLNRDGKPDLAVANDTGSIVWVLLGTGGGAFGGASSFGVGSQPRSVAIGDLNGDGKLDLAVANVNSANVSVLLGDGVGGFGAATPFTVGTGPISVAIGDLNGDGKPDLATANLTNTVSVLLGTGTGSFGVATNFAVAGGSGPYSVAIGDLNGDGKPDLATANSNSANVSVLLGTGTGSFGAATNFAVVAGSSPFSVAIGDLNGDGKPDLAVAD